MQEHSRRALAVVVLAAIGLGLSLVIENVHRQLAADLTYASFCNVSTTVNCDVVLTSSYAELAGVSVSLIAAVYYLGLLVAAAVLMGSRGVSRRQTLATTILGVACVGFIFSLYLAIVAVAILRTICVLCGGLYLVAVGMLVAAWLLRNAEQRVGRKDQAALARRERWVWSATAAAVAILVITVGWQAMRGKRSLSAEEIQQQRPDYYRYFFAQPQVEIPAHDGPARGDSNAAVTIVEFSDFGCSHCAAFDHRIGELLRRETGVRLVFRYFPLDSKCNPAISGPASGDRCMAAAAAECASEQDKFWQYARLLFDNQPSFSATDLRGFAREVGMDLERFDSCLAREDVHRRVAEDAKLGVKLGVSSTPTLFLNGRRLKGDPGENLADAIVLARHRPR
jgi:protein-disulfide isomerase/uncharacterized membrane protein